jgi:RNA polymerase sigma-70 factor (ECF subfamily)
VTPTPRDADLLARIAVGDRVAFEAFYRRHAVWLALRLRYRCADGSLVDDVVQETFLDLWRGGASNYREPGDVAGWLWRIGSRRLVDALRRQGTWDRLRQMLTWFRPSEESAESSAEDLVLRGVEHGDLGGALARLSPDLRAVVQATVLDGLSTGEAAVLLGIPPGTVKTRAMRARRQLRQDLA